MFCKKNKPILNSVLITFIIVSMLFIGMACNDEKLVNGAKCPDIALPNALGDTLRLSEVGKGKVVLVDFWASWCKPCRESHPELRRIYEKFKDARIGGANGFTIYSVSLDNEAATWISAAQNDSLLWPNLVIDTRAFGSPYTDIFQFGQIPTSYLVDERGVIIGKNLSMKWLQYELGRR